MNPDRDRSGGWGFGSGGGASSPRAGASVAPVRAERRAPVRGTPSVESGASAPFPVLPAPGPEQPLHQEELHQGRRDPRRQRSFRLPAEPDRGRQLRFRCFRARTGTAAASGRAAQGAPRPTPPTALPAPSRTRPGASAPFPVLPAPGPEQPLHQEELHEGRRDPRRQRSFRLPAEPDRGRQLRFRCFQRPDRNSRCIRKSCTRGAATHAANGPSGSQPNPTRAMNVSDRSSPHWVIIV